MVSITRPQAELWFLGAMLRDNPEYTHDARGLGKAKAEHVGTVQAEHFREPLLRAAWLAAVDEYAETGNATVAGVVGRLGASVEPDRLRDVEAMLTYARDYAEGLRSNGRWYAKYIAEEQRGR